MRVLTGAATYRRIPQTVISARNLVSGCKFGEITLRRQDICVNIIFTGKYSTGIINFKMKITYFF